MVSSSSGLEFDLHFEPGRRLVDQIDRLVRQKTVGDVAVRQGRGGNDRRVGDPHPVMLLVFLLQPTQDRNRILDGRLGDEHGLEPSRQGGVLLDVLLVFVERGRADAVQFPPRQRRLQQVGRIHGAVGLAGPDEGMHLVDEQDDAALGGRHLLQYGFEALLEFPTVFRTRNERAHVEGEQLLVGKTLRHIAIDDAQRQPLDDRGLADAGFADQHRIVLGATGQHLDGAADFLVAADHRIELAVAGGLGQVAGIFLECVIGIFGRRRVRGAALAQGFNGRVQILRRDPGAGQNFPRLVVLLDGERQQQPLDRHEGIAGFFRRLLRGLEHARKRRIHIKLPGTTAGDLGPLRQCRLDGGQSFTRMTSRAVDQSGR